MKAESRSRTRPTPNRSDIRPGFAGDWQESESGADQTSVCSHRAQLAHPLVRLLAIAAAMLAGAIAPAAVQAAETGVGTDLASPEVTRKTQDRTATALRDVDARWARLIMNWTDSVEPSDGLYNPTTLSTFDRAVDLARGA